MARRVVPSRSRSAVRLNIVFAADQGRILFAWVKEGCSEAVAHGTLGTGSLPRFHAVELGAQFGLWWAGDS